MGHCPAFLLIKLSPYQKFKIAKEHMTPKTLISDICKKYDIVPSLFYKWQDNFLSGALKGFEKSDDGLTSRKFLHHFLS